MGEKHGHAVLEEGAAYSTAASVYRHSSPSQTCRKPGSWSRSPCARTSPLSKSFFVPFPLAPSGEDGVDGRARKKACRSFPKPAARVVETPRLLDSTFLLQSSFG